MGLAAMMPHIQVTSASRAFLWIADKEIEDPWSNRNELFDLVTLFWARKPSALIPLGIFESIEQLSRRKHSPAYVGARYASEKNSGIAFI